MAVYPLLSRSLGSALCCRRYSTHLNAPQQFYQNLLRYSRRDNTSRKDKTFALLHKEHSLSLQVLCCSLVERCAAIHILLVHLTSNPNQCEHTWILALSSCIVQGNPILCILQLEVGTTADEEIQAVN